MSRFVAQTVPFLPAYTRKRFALGPFSLGILTIAADFVAILAAATLTGVGYHVFAYDSAGSLQIYAAVGALLGFAYTLPFSIRGAYRLHSFVERRRSASTIATAWICAILVLGTIGFLTKTTASFSRGWLMMLFAAGYAAVYAADAFCASLLQRAVRHGWIARRRVMIVGQQDTLERICANTDTSRAGMEIAAAAILPPHDAADVSEGLAAAVTRARQARVEDVVILMDGCDRRDFDTLVAAFGALPVSIQLGVTPAAGRHIDEHVGRLGAVPLLALKRPPMHVGQKVAKRAFDIVVASAALVLLSPLLLLIALLIKLDSPGPVFFRQRRRGYNQEEFRIWKFRTMSTMEDGDVVRQATAGDERVTRLGHYLRRFNLDELPQLLNVLTGEMSIVGPRPHAVAHDRIFEQRIAAYPRRLNVPPGITGWAQVNGLRGATDDERMRQRVAHDLYYIENWSLALDLYILLLTVVSPKAYRNAH